VYARPSGKPPGTFDNNINANRAPAWHRAKDKTMTTIIDQLNAEEIARVMEGKTIPDFSPGDVLKVNVKIREGERERVQAYEGVCIARSGGGINQAFTVRKISFGEGVERIFPLFSPSIESIVLVRKGKVRRAKLYYLRDRRGKSARISERTTGRK
jgi:large subunit ribosomal protein L19